MSMISALRGSPQALDDTTLRTLYAASASAYSAATYRATTTSQIPLRVVDGNGDPVDGVNPLMHVLADSKPMLYEITLSLLIWGRFYLLKRLNAHQSPTRLEWVNPVDVREVYERGRIVSKYQVRGSDYGQYDVNVRDMVYGQMFDTDPDGRGLSKFEVALKALNLDHGMLTSAGAFFVNGARIDGMIELPAELTDEDVEKARQSWVTSFQGARNAHSTAVMPSGTKYTQIGAAPVDLAMSALREDTRREIYQIMGVDPSLTGVEATSDPMSGGTYDAKFISHLRTTTLPMLETVILPALNDTWVQPDFHGQYRIEVDHANIEALNEARLALSQTAVLLLDSGIHDYSEARDMMGMPERDGAHLLRKASEPLSVYTGGLATLNEARALIGLPPLGRDVFLLNGTAYPIDRLDDALNAQVDRALAQATMLTPTGGLPDPLNPAPTIALDAERADELPDTSFCLALTLPSGDLLSKRREVQAYCDRVGARVLEWNDPTTFHVTLVYAPETTPAQIGAGLLAVSSIPTPAFDIAVGTLDTFDGVGRYPLILRVRSNPTLLAYQRALYDALVGICPALSAYSVPERWQPHVTLGYADRKVPRWTVRKPLHVRSTTMVAWHGADGEEVYRAVASPPPAVAPGTLPVVRSRADAVAVRIAAPFGGNEFVKATRREIASALPPGIAWDDDSTWKIALVQTSTTRASAAAALQGIDLTDTRRIGLWTRAVEQTEYGAICLTFEPSSALEKLAASMRLLLPDADAMRQMVRIGHSANRVIDAPLTINRRLIVLDRLSVDTDDSTVTIEFGHAAPVADQTREMTRWRQVAGRDMARAAAFETDALPDRVVTFIRAALIDGDEDLDGLFSAAARLLDGNAVRAWTASRAGFAGQILPVLKEVQTGTLTRATFIRRMNDALNTWGYAAFRDGMNEMGEDTAGLSPEQLSAYAAWYRTHTAFVRGLADEMFVQRAIQGDEADRRPMTDAEIAHRVQMWSDITLEAAREAGIAAISTEVKLIRVIDAQSESCRDCIRLANKVYRYSEWHAAGLTPTQGNTACRMGCKCRLVVADPKARLSPLALLKALSPLANVVFESGRRSADDDADRDIDNGEMMELAHQCDETCGCDGYSVRDFVADMAALYNAPGGDA